MIGGGLRFVARAIGALAIGVVAFGVAAPAAAQQDPGWVARTTARLQFLDKVTARVSLLEAPVGRPTPFATLTILVSACHARPADEVPDAAAWMEITDSRRREADKLAFRGWLFANTPAANMLEHPVYDLRVLDCR